MLKKLMLTTAIGGLMISGAMAQSPAPAERSAPMPSATAPADSTMGKAAVVTTQKPDQFLASKFKGTDVLGSDDKKIGDVSDILFDKDGKIEAFVVSVGGFLGMGAKDVALAPSSFQVMKGAENESDKLKITMTQDELKQAANFEPYQAPRTTTGSGSNGAPARPAPASR